MKKLNGTGRRCLFYLHPSPPKRLHFFMFLFSFACPPPPPLHTSLPSHDAIDRHHTSKPIAKSVRNAIYPPTIGGFQHAPAAAISRGQRRSTSSSWSCCIHPLMLHGKESSTLCHPTLLTFPSATSSIPKWGLGISHKPTRLFPSMRISCAAYFASCKSAGHRGYGATWGFMYQVDVDLQQ